MSLQDWLKKGRLKKHQTSREEIADLFGLADRDLDACQTENLVTDWKFNIAYNAALQLATAALAAAGFLAERMAHHYRVISSLEFTIGLDKDIVETLNEFREKRNESDYERAGAISEADCAEMLALAQRLREEVEQWIAVNYPHLKP